MHTTISMPVDCPKCGYALQYDTRLNAFTCFCGIELYKNVFNVRILTCEKCGEPIQARNGKRKFCASCKKKDYNETRKKPTKEQHALCQA